MHYFVLALTNFTILSNAWCKQQSAHNEFIAKEDGNLLSSSPLVVNQQRLHGNVRGGCRENPMRVLALFCLANMPATARNPVRNAIPSVAMPAVARNPVRNAIPSVAMRINEETSKKNARALRIRAEQAALQAQQAAAEAERLELQLQELKLARAAVKPRETESDSFADASLAPSPTVTQMHSWPYNASRLYSVVRDDPTVEGYFCKTRERFMGTRKGGVYEDSFQVHFSLPGENNACKTVELLPASRGTPSFGAVKVTVASFLTHVLYIEDLWTKDRQADELDVTWDEKLETWMRDLWMNKAEVSSTNSSTHMMVYEVDDEGTIDNYVDMQHMVEMGDSSTQNLFSSIDISRGDIIRAVSMPQLEEIKEDAPFWKVFTQSIKNYIVGSHMQEDLYFLDGRRIGDLNKMMTAWKVSGGIEAEMVLIIERPDEATRADILKQSVKHKLRSLGFSDI